MPRQLASTWQPTRPVSAAPNIRRFPIGLIFAHDSQNANGCGFTQHHWLDTSPRLGLVWDPTGRRKADHSRRVRPAPRHHRTLLSGALDYQPAVRFLYHSDQPAPSPRRSPNPWNGYVSPTGVAGDPFRESRSSPPWGTYVSVPPNMPATYVMQWNLSYSRQIAKDWLATATYIGNRTNHIYGAYDINAPAACCRTPPPWQRTGSRRVLSLINPTAGGSLRSGRTV